MVKLEFDKDHTNWLHSDEAPTEDDLEHIQANASKAELEGFVAQQVAHTGVEQFVEAELAQMGILDGDTSGDGGTGEDQ